MGMGSSFLLYLAGISFLSTKDGISLLNLCDVWRFFLLKRQAYSPFCIRAETAIWIEASISH
jgi:hypothetical protein